MAASSSSNKITHNFGELHKVPDDLDGLGLTPIDCDPEEWFTFKKIHSNAGVSLQHFYNLLVAFLLTTSNSSIFDVFPTMLKMFDCRVLSRRVLEPFHESVRLFQQTMTALYRFEHVDVTSIVQGICKKYSENSSFLWKESTSVGYEIEYILDMCVLEVTNSVFEFIAHRLGTNMPPDAHQYPLGDICKLFIVCIDPITVDKFSGVVEQIQTVHPTMSPECIIFRMIFWKSSLFTDKKSLDSAMNTLRRAIDAAARGVRIKATADRSTVCFCGCSSNEHTIDVTISDIGTVIKGFLKFLTPPRESFDYSSIPEGNHYLAYLARKAVRRAAYNARCGVRV
jgi:hypothetical protein